VNNIPGVLHIVFAGDHWPIKYLRDRWVKIHNAPQMVIRHIPKNDEDEQKRVISYQMKQYLYNQDAYIRFSCSRNWLFPGYREVWLELIEKFGFEHAKKLWDGLLHLKHMPGQINFYGQIVLTYSERQKVRVMKRKKHKIGEKEK